MCSFFLSMFLIWRFKIDQNRVLNHYRGIETTAICESKQDHELSCCIIVPLGLRTPSSTAALSPGTALTKTTYEGYLIVGWRDYIDHLPIWCQIPVPKIHIRPVFSRFALCLQDCCAFLETSPWIKVWYSKESMRVVSTPQLLSSFFVVPSAKLRKSETFFCITCKLRHLNFIRIALSNATSSAYGFPCLMHY